MSHRDGRPRDSGNAIFAERYDTNARLAAMRERIRKSEADYGHGSAYDDLRSICAALDARLTIAVIERNEACAKLAKVRQELAASLECDCGTCLACRVADVVGA